MEVQAALLRVQLTRLENQNETRRKNAAHLTKRLEQVEGIDPMVIDPRGSHYSVHIYMMRYRPENFNNLPRAKFLEALNAEGIPAFSGYTHPVYKNPMFLEKNFYKKGCPVNCGHYPKDIDYQSFAATCPVSERAAEYEAIWLEHKMFLGPQKDMDDIADAIIKIKENIHELQ
jgi:dTDP-4-amino-4,6-dideoxygalactose transaminase